MSTAPIDCDLIVLGLGTAGAMAAFAGARAGLRVRAFERRPLETAGARWVNALPAASFDEARLPRPEAPELRALGHRFHMKAGWTGPTLPLSAEGVLEVDMRLLVARLHRLAVEAGARLAGGATIEGWRTEDGAVTVDGPDGSIRGRFLVDARGMVHGEGAVPRELICAAAHEIRALTDRPRAEAWFRSHGVTPGETLCFTGVEGGFSVLNVRLELDTAEALAGAGSISILTGSIPGQGHPSGRQMLDRFVAEHRDWIGPLHFGGARPIPLGLPQASLAEGPVARIGDAAGQVFAMHGSGIGAGLVAAELLATTLARGGSPWDYNVAWQRRYGGLFAGSAVFAAWSRALRPEDLARLFEAGLMNPHLARMGLLQQPARPRPADLPGLAFGLLRAPGTAARLAPALLAMERLNLHAGRYPGDPAALSAWSAARDRIAGLPAQG